MSTTPTPLRTLELSVRIWLDCDSFKTYNSVSIVVNGKQVAVLPAAVGYGQEDTALVRAGDALNELGYDLPRPLLAMDLRKAGVTFTYSVTEVAKREQLEVWPIADTSPLRTVAVTIGRNVPTRFITEATLVGLVDNSDVPQLTDAAWADYTDRIIGALEIFARNVEATTSWVETHDGVGEWDGVQEQSRKVTLLYQAESTRTLDTIELEIDVKSARSGFYNDAAAISYGESKLI